MSFINCIEAAKKRGITLRGAEGSQERLDHMEEIRHMVYAELREKRARERKWPQLTYINGHTDLWGVPLRRKKLIIKRITGPSCELRYLNREINQFQPCEHAADIKLCGDDGIGTMILCSHCYVKLFGPDKWQEGNPHHPDYKPLEEIPYDYSTNQ
jgi:hypothetical protein